MALPEAGRVEVQTTADRASQWVVFACAGYRFAVPIGRIREIQHARPRTRLPGCGAEVAGLINLRGRIVTVIDFGAALGLAPAAEIPDHYLLLLERGERIVAVAVDEVVGLAAASPSAVADGAGLSVPAEALRALDISREHLVGIGALDDQPFMAVDPDTIIDTLLT